MNDYNYYKCFNYFKTLKHNQLGLVGTCDVQIKQKERKDKLKRILNFDVEMALLKDFFKLKSNDKEINIDEFLKLCEKNVY